MAYNVVIKRQVQATNVDTYNRSAVHSADLPNGSVFSLKTKNTAEKGLWDVSAPEAFEKGLWMATSPEVIRVTKTSGGSNDPRDFVNVASCPIDCTYLAPKDLVEMTGVGITGIASATYLTASTGLTLVGVTALPTGGLIMTKVDTDTLKIGDGGIAPAEVPTYIFEVVAN